MKAPGHPRPPQPTQPQVPQEYVLAAAAHMNNLGKLFDQPSPTPQAPPDVPAP